MSDKPWPNHRQTHPDPVEGCEGCKIVSLSIGFHTCPGGRDEFKGPTIKQRQDREYALAAKEGIEIQPKVTSANVWAPVK